MAERSRPRRAHRGEPAAPTGGGAQPTSRQGGLASSTHTANTVLLADRVLVLGSPRHIQGRGPVRSPTSRSAQPPLRSPWLTTLMPPHPATRNPATPNAPAAHYPPLHRRTPSRPGGIVEIGSPTTAKPTCPTSPPSVPSGRYLLPRSMPRHARNARSRRAQAFLTDTGR